MRTSTDAPPLVSVITPSYNQAQFIEETIQSVARQCYPNIEHIVVDGCSDDGTIDILKEYDNQLIWVSEPDEGQSDAINKGFDMANGDVVAWLNSDDVLFDVNVLDRVVKYFEQLDADIVYGDMALLDNKSDVLKLQIVPDFDYAKLQTKCFIEQPSLFFRSHVLEEERLNTSLEYVMDYEFWLRLARNYEFQHVDEVFSGDRNHKQRKILNHRKEMQAEAEELRARYGGSTGNTRQLQNRIYLVTSGIPRAMKSIIRTIRMHRKDPELAFDGELQDQKTMIKNIFRPNRSLV
ncbi:MAG: glycosyltransferase family 2 protein [Halobacteriaceae archaeon]